MSVLIWADVPVLDMDRARRFYGTLLGVEMMQFPGESSVAIPPRESGPIAFDLAKTDTMKPCADGVCIYFDAAGDIEGMVGRVAEAGGQVLQGPTDMGQMVGTVAFVLDTEGNRIGIRQANPEKPT